MAAAPRAPARAPSSVAPVAWAASSSTGTPSSAISSTGATFPNRCTTTTALVLGVMAARTVSAVTQKVAGSTSQYTGTAPTFTVASTVAKNVNEGQIDLVARPDPQSAQGDRDGVGAVGHPDRVPDAQVGGELALEGLDLRPEDEAPSLEHLGEGLGEARLVGVEARRKEGNGHGGPLPYPAAVTLLASITDPIVNLAVDVVDAIGLLGIFVLMTLESACIPVPSEATMLFAGFAVSEGEYSLVAAVAVGIGGQPRGLVDRVRHRLLRARGRAREARQEAPHQEEPPRDGGPLVRASRRRHGVLHPHAPHRPHVHLAARRGGPHALLALQRVHARWVACRGC